jgi:hypothetical protein
MSSDRGTLSELVLYTLDTTPYTDVNGYQHIGGFPNGATLVLGDDSSIQDAPSETKNMTVGIMASIRPEGAIDPEINPLGYPTSSRVQLGKPLDDGEAGPTLSGNGYIATDAAVRAGNSVLGGSPYAQAANSTSLPPSSPVLVAIIPK